MQEGGFGLGLVPINVSWGERSEAQSSARQMSPTIFRERGYWFFFSREEPQTQVHMVCAEGEAKYWLEPDIDPAKNNRL